MPGKQQKRGILKDNFSIFCIHFHFFLLTYWFELSTVKVLYSLISCILMVQQTKKTQSTASHSDVERLSDLNSRKESKLTGSVKFSTYKRFFAAANKPFHVIIVLMSFILAQIAFSSTDFFLSGW